MTMEAIGQLATRLSASTLALASLGAVLDEKTGGARLDPAIKGEIERLIGTFGVPEMLSGVKSSELGPIVADVRSTLLQATRILLNPTNEPGWKLADSETLQSQGKVSARLPHNWSENIVPCLEGLSARLASKDGAFLDVGVGVAALSISMARLWPSLRVVGIDPWVPALEIGRENVAQANLSTRIELREQGVQDLPDTNVFDLAWLPSQFIGAALIRPAVECIYQALRPGGWILVAAVGQNPDPQVTAYLRLRDALRGGCALTPVEIEGLLRDVGYVQVQTVARAGTSRSSIVVGRKQTRG